jgi:lipopolysaccharide export system permease protein
MVFIATVFFTSRIAARTEIVAMLSSGMSFQQNFAALSGWCYGTRLHYFCSGWMDTSKGEIKPDTFEKAYVKMNLLSAGETCISPLRRMYTPIWKVITMLQKPGISSRWKPSKAISFCKKLSADKMYGSLKSRNGHFRISR